MSTNDIHPASEGGESDQNTQEEAKLYPASSSEVAKHSGYPAEGELNDEELGKVAGGKKDMVI